MVCVQLVCLLKPECGAWQCAEGVLNTNTKDVDFMKGRGTRSVSTSRKLPSYSFGRAARDKYHKEYLNKEMAVRFPAVTSWCEASV